MEHITAPGWTIKLALRLTALLMVLVIAVPAALAQERTFSEGNARITIGTEPCTDEKVLAHVPEQFQPYMKAGRGIYDGAPYALCWAITGGVVVVIVWEDGGIGRIPLSGFEIPGV